MRKQVRVGGVDGSSEIEGGGLGAQHQVEGCVVALWRMGDYVPSEI